MNIDIDKELYHGWLILAVLVDSFWSIECHKPEGEIYTDTIAYETSEQAMQAARSFVQRYTAKTALLQALSEYWNVNFLREK